MEYHTGKLLEEIKSDLRDLTGLYYDDKGKLENIELVRRTLNDIVFKIEKELND